MQRQNFNSGGFGHNNYLHAGRGGGGGFNPRAGGPYNQPPGGPPSSFGNSFGAQRPPVGDFSRGGPQQQHHQQQHGGGMLGGPSGNSYFGANSGGPLDPSVLEQKAIETARYELDLLEAKKHRKRTMTNEDLPEGDQRAAGNSYIVGDNNMPRVSRNNNNFGPRSRDDGPPDNRWGGGSHRQEEYGGGHNNNHNGPMGGGGSFGGYNDGGGAGPRVPYRTRGPSFDNTSAEHYNRSLGAPGGGGGYQQGGSGHGMNQPYLGLPASAEPTWERVKRPEPPALNTRSVG